MKRREFIGYSGCLFLTASVSNAFCSEKNILLPVKYKEKFGYINQNAEMIIKPIYEDADFFRNGMAGVRLNGKWGYVDHYGELIINPKYNLTGRFSKTGYAKVCPEAIYNWHIIDKRDNNLDEVYKKRIEGPFREGLAPFKDNGDIGFIDIQGNIIIEPKFVRARGFNNGNSLVRTPPRNNSFLGIIDKEGNYVIKPEYKILDPFWENLACAATKNERGYIDITGNFITKRRYDMMLSFTDGRGIVSIGDKYGAVNNKGEIIIPLKFNRLEQFSEKMAMFASDKGKFGFLDLYGDIAIRPIYDDIYYQFICGLAAVKLKDRWGYITKSGEIVIDPNYYRFSNLENGIVRVYFDIDEERFGYFDKTGKQIWPCN